MPTKREKLKPPTLGADAIPVVVEWIDARGNGGWIDVGGLRQWLEDHEARRMQSYGHLIHHEKERVVLAMSGDRKGPELTLWGDLLEIPMGMVVSIHHLKTGGPL